MSLARSLFSVALGVLTPLAFARLWWKGRSNPDYRLRWKERLGFVSPAHVKAFPVKPRLWIHAVSVGEVIAATPLIRAWQARHPDWAVLVTTTTPTGSAQLRRNFGESVEHVYLPFDLPGAVRRFYARTQPTRGVIMETELWPNLFAEAKWRGIPLLLANARLSERSMRGYAKLRGLVAETLACLSLIAARDAQDVARFIALGALPDKVEALGNLKFDLDIALGVRERGQAWRAQFGAERWVWIAASTHPGEDEQVLQAHRKVQEQRPDALLLLAPRHPERANELARLIQAQGFAFERRSNLNVGANSFAHPSLGIPHVRMNSHLPESATVVLIDTLGELMDFYAASDVAFVGGSLVTHGGHNPLEPLALGLPVISGEAVFNFAEIYAAMRAEDLVTWVSDVESLATAVLAASKIHENPRGLDFLARHKGALGKLVNRIEKNT
ncbi:MAG: 3-deoxy-D-manno-octulosonic acid transferase [Halothiobacillaceae bacterium]|nr:3-deoxy-D-manno-octulosonic acid transferase [Halothiobacillaceae bacterium]